MSAVTAGCVLNNAKLSKKPCLFGDSMEEAKEKSRAVIHIFCKNSIPLCRIVYKDMGDCADQFSILNDSAAAHPLDDKSGLLQKKRNCNAYDHILSRVILAKGNLVNNDVKKLRRIAGNCCQNLGGPFFDLLAKSHGKLVRVCIIKK